ncbi:MAG: signal peptidase I [Bacilli bacterium]|nr:signal peptidase I [Bacilli bacterium]
MKLRSLKNTFVLLMLTIYVVLYKLFIFQKYMQYSEIITASFLAVLLAISIALLGFRKDKNSVLGKNVFKIVVFYLALTFLVMYGLGMMVGFLKNAYSRDFSSIFDNIFSPIIIIIMVEFIRYTVINANKDKKIVVILITLLLILLELVISIRSFDFTDLAGSFNITATIILPCIFKNYLLSYFAYHIGYKIPIMYRLIMDIYVFIVPLIPNLGDYVNSMISISLPILIYISVFSMIDDRVSRSEPIFNKKTFTVWDIPVAIVLISLVALISGFFPHYMVGIGSNSMSPVIRKGDAVILKKVNDKTELRKGDIIAYSNGKLIIVHRIKQINHEGNKITYTMKGDANNSNDPRNVSRQQIKGIVKFRIPVIAWPTVWLTELFNS